MAKVSLCMIVRDEESILEKCLESIKSIPDEIIITDTGSTDSTIAIAEKYADRVEQFQWIDDFSAARNYCDRFASYEYIMTWDADNILQEASLEQLLKLKQKDFNDLDLIYGSWHTELSDSGEPIKTTVKPFLYRRQKFHWESAVHNILVANSDQTNIKEKILYEIEFSHYKDRDLKSYRYNQTQKILEKELSKNETDTRLLFYYGESLIYDQNFTKAKQVFNKFLTLDNNSEQTIFAIEKLMLIHLNLGEAEQALDLAKQYYDRYKSNPRFLLTFADCTAVNDLVAAKAYYQKYLENPVKQHNKNLFYDHERFAVHPHWMLGNIFLLTGETEKAITLLKFVTKNTSSTEKQQQALNLIKQTK